MREWPTRALGELADIRISNVDKKSVPGEMTVRLCNYMDAYANDYIRSDIDFMQATASASEIARFSVVAGDVVLTKDSETPDDIGIPAVVMDQIDDLVCGYHLALLKTKQELIDPVFLCKQLGTSRAAQYFGQRATGSTRYGLPNRALSTFQIPVPPLAVQKRIARVLQAIDTAIEKTEALIAKHQQIKAGLMHDLFTRGVLPNGQLRPPRSEAPELYQETEIGWIPRGWRVEQAGTLCSLITKGTTPAAHEMWQEGEGIRFLRVDNLTFDGQLDFLASSYKVSVGTHMGALSRSRCLPGDVLTNIVGPPLGKVGLVTEETGELNINQAIAVFRAKELLMPQFLLSWLTTETVKRWFLQRAKQTSGQLNLTLGMCQSMPVPLMALAEQQLILDRFQSSEKLVAAEQSRLRQLSAQKLGLMQDLLTGRVPVSATPEPAEAAA